MTLWTEALKFDGLCATCGGKLEHIDVGQLVTYHGAEGDRVARADCPGCIAAKNVARRSGVNPTELNLVLFMEALDVIRSVRQQVHQAHHHGEIEHCSMNTCTAAADILRRAQVTP